MDAVLTIDYGAHTIVNVVQALVQWIASCAETHTSQLLFLFARWFVRKEADPVGVEALAVVTALVKLHSTKTGMAKLVHKDARKYHEKILGGYLCMLRGTTEMRSIAIERYFLNPCLECFRYDTRMPIVP